MDTDKHGFGLICIHPCPSVIGTAAVSEGLQLGPGSSTPAATYTLTINGVQDTAATPNTIAPNTQVQFLTYGSASGVILHKKYVNCTDTYTLTDFFSDPRYPGNPDREDVEPIWPYPSSSVGFPSAAEPDHNWCDTLEGYFIPPATTNYVFFICGADEYYLCLSTDDTPANMYQICAEPGGWTDRLSWLTGQGGVNMTTMRSDQNTGTLWPNGATISLTKGQRYYMLSMHHTHSWSGDDDQAVTYTMAGAPDPADGTAPPLTGNLIAYDVDPNGASISFSQPPQSVTTLEGTSVSFSVLATSTSDYADLTTPFHQWQLAPKGSTTWTTIAGATSASYSMSLLGLADNGDQLRVEYQDGSSAYARAGIIARDVLNFGVNSTNQTGTTPTGTGTTPPYNGLAGRYQKCHVDPVGATLAGPGTAGNAHWEGNRRLDTGGLTTSGITNSAFNTVPPYPNAWCRLQRVGQTFTIFASVDGVNWTAIGSTTWPDPADPNQTLMPDTLYVGPEFSPETRSITLPADQGTFLAQFRDYGDYVASSSFNPQLAIGLNAGKAMFYRVMQ